MAESAFYRPVCESDLIVLSCCRFKNTCPVPGLVLNALFGTSGESGFTTYRKKDDALIRGIISKVW